MLYPAVGHHVIAEEVHFGYVYLIPGLGAHRLDKLQPEHLGKLYTRIQANRSSPGTAHQVHRLRTWRSRLPA